MSAWLVLSSLGIYQVCPGCGTNVNITTVTSANKGGSVGGGEYVLNAPLFDNITVFLPLRDHGSSVSGKRNLAYQIGIFLFC